MSEITKKRRKRGRPNRAAATARALRNVDLSAVDPVAILREIAADRSQPGSARASAAKSLALLDAQNAKAVATLAERDRDNNHAGATLEPAGAHGPSPDERDADEVNRLAVAALARARERLN